MFQNIPKIFYCPDNIVSLLECRLFPKLSRKLLPTPRSILYVQKLKNFLDISISRVFKYTQSWKNRFFFKKNLTFTFDFIFILLRQSKNKKKYLRHKIDVKFPAEFIHTVRINFYIDLYLEILIFVLIFDFPASPYLVSWKSF